MTQQKIDKTEALPEREEVISIAPHLQQQILRLVGMADSTYLGNDLVYRLKVVDILIEYVGEEFIANRLKKEGRDWSKIHREIMKISRRLQKAKPIYDLLEDKQFSKADKDVTGKADFIREISKIPLIDNPIIMMYVWLARKTNMHRWTVPSENYKILEHSQYKTFLAPKRPLGSQSQESSST